MPRNRAVREHHVACQHECGGGYGTLAFGVKGAITAAIFEAYHVEEVLASNLHSVGGGFSVRPSPILPSSQVLNEQKLIWAHRFVRQSLA
jgi:hypothetical protein